ncbi:DNA glycosylase [Haematococcus lacustris]
MEPKSPSGRRIIGIAALRKDAHEAPHTPDAPLKRRRSSRLATKDDVTPQQPAAQVMVDALAPTLYTPAPPPSFLTLQDLERGGQHLQQADPVLAPLIQEHGLPTQLLSRPGVSPFSALVKSVVYQQLHGKAAATIHARLLDLCGVAAEQELSALTPGLVLAQSTADLRRCGLSERKAAYVLGLAHAFGPGRQLSDEGVRGMDDLQLLQALTALKGVGPWTVHMVSIFNLGRPDVLPVGDLAVRKGMQLLYQLPDPVTAADMERVAEAWRPYRSLGAYYMWRVPAASSSTPSRKK